MVDREAHYGVHNDPPHWEVRRFLLLSKQGRALSQLLAVITLESVNLLSVVTTPSISLSVVTTVEPDLSGLSPGK
jgi:hypothetical protein